MYTQITKHIYKYIRITFSISIQLILLILNDVQKFKSA